jgi:molecular chaperone GrpE
MESEQHKVEEEPQADDVDSLRNALEAEKAKAERYLTNWQRAEADFDNYKKRAEQERTENAKFSNMALSLNLLPVLDDFRRAFDSLSANLAGLTWVDGVRLIYRKLQAVLEAQGLSEIKSIGEQFDPAIHEAVTQAEGEEGKVIEEVQKGYRLYDRVIRPALVVVGRGWDEKKKEEQRGEAED